jgi:hypothetical protein
MTILLPDFRHIKLPFIHYEMSITHFPSFQCQHDPRSNFLLQFFRVLTYFPSPESDPAFPSPLKLAAVSGMLLQAKCNSFTYICYI